MIERAQRKADVVGTDRIRIVVQKTPEQLLGIGLPHLRSAQGPVARRLLEEGGIALPCFPGRFLELGLSRRIPLLLVQGHAPVVMGLRTHKDFFLITIQIIERAKLVKFIDPLRAVPK